MEKSESSWELHDDIVARVTRLEMCSMVAWLVLAVYTIVMSLAWVHHNYVSHPSQNAGIEVKGAVEQQKVVAPVKPQALRVDQEKTSRQRANASGGRRA